MLSSRFVPSVKGMIINMNKIISFIRARFRKWLLEEIWIEDYKKRGMKIGKGCSIQPGVIFDYSHCNLISIGNNVGIAPQVYFLVHDASTKKELGYTKIGAITIEDNVFIGARTIILPGVTVGKNSIVGAGSVVIKDVPPNTIVVGNPAKVIGSKSEYIQKNKELMDISYLFGEEYTFSYGYLDDEKKQEINDKLKNGVCFIR